MKIPQFIADYLGTGKQSAVEDEMIE